MPAARPLLLAALLVFAAPFAGASYDLRLVVQADWLDDPQKREAVSLLLHLLPPGGRAGLWTYGESVETRVELAEVSADWRDRALAALLQSSGSSAAGSLPAAVDTALAPAAADPDWPRALLLIGDGRVDVSASPMVNASSARALEARFSTAGPGSWPIYSALSGGGPGADLLQALAAGSGGQALPELDSLAATWLRVLNAALPMTRLPRGDGLVRVPEGTVMLTWLIASGNPSLTISPPDEASATGETRVRFAEYRLRRWESPPAGEWRVEGQDAPRASVYTALPYTAARRGLPARLRAGESLTGVFQLLEHGAPATIPVDWDWRSRLTGPGGLDLATRPAAQPEGLSLEFPPLQQPGWYRLELEAGRGADRLGWVYWVKVDPAATGSSISTRPPALPEADLRTAALSLLAFVLLTAIVISWVLRRRRRHKLRLWEQRRGRST